MRVAAAVLAAAFAATPVYWTPAKMAAALTAANYPRASVLGGTCVGVGKRRGATFAAFKCRITWQQTVANSGKTTVYAKPLTHGRVCASTRSLAACKPLPPGPLAGDPRVCDATRSDPAEQARLCTEAAAETAARKHVGGPGGLYQGSTDCTATSTFVYSCTLGTAVYTVTFTKGATGWSTTVTP